MFGTQAKGAYLIDYKSKFLQNYCTSVNQDSQIKLKLDNISPVLLSTNTNLHIPLLSCHYCLAIIVLPLLSCQLSFLSNGLSLNNDDMAKEVSV